jgi:hypothetical protein
MAQLGIWQLFKPHQILVDWIHWMALQCMFPMDHFSGQSHSAIINTSSRPLLATFFSLAGKLMELEQMQHFKALFKSFPIQPTQFCTSWICALFASL